MQSRKRNATLALAALFLILFSGISVYAQNSATTDSPRPQAVPSPNPTPQRPEFGGTCEQALDELKVRRLESLSFAEQKKLWAEKESAFQEQIADLKDQRDNWKEAATARKEALAKDDRVEILRQEQQADFRAIIAEQKQRIGELEAEVAKLQKSRLKWAAGALFLGSILKPSIPFIK